MLEPSMITSSRAKNYNNTSPGSILMHLDGTAGQQAGSGTGSIGSTESNGNSTSSGIYSSAKFINSVVAYGTTAVDVSAATTGVIFCNPTKANINNQQGDFTIEFYIAKKNANMTQANPLCTDRYSSDLTTSFPGLGYPPSGTTTMRAMSYLFYIDIDKTCGFALQGMMASDTNWWTLRRSTGVNYWDQLSTTKMTHVLFQMRNKVLEGYLGGNRQFQIAAPNWTGTPYQAQIDLGNDYSLGNASKDLFFDEMRYTKDIARAKGNFNPPTTAFTV